jgi:hypothetical protein
VSTPHDDPTCVVGLLAHQALAALIDDEKDRAAELLREIAERDKWTGLYHAVLIFCDIARKAIGGIALNPAGHIAMPVAFNADTGETASLDSVGLPAELVITMQIWAARLNGDRDMGSALFVSAIDHGHAFNVVSASLYLAAVTVTDATRRGPAT